MIIHWVGKYQQMKRQAQKYLQINRTLTTILYENVATPILSKSIDVQLY